MPPEISVNALQILGGLLVANIGVIISAYISLKVELKVGRAVTDVKVGRLEQDVNNLANMFRDQFKKGEK